MARTAVSSVWQDGVSVIKGLVRQWASEVIARQPFETIAELNAATVYGAGTDVMSVLVKGYYTAGDGGGGLWQYAASAPSHNGKTTSNGGAVTWVLASEFPNAKQFGAKFDGPVDGTIANAGNTTDDFTTITNFISYLRATNKMGWFPHGATYCSDTIYAGGTLIHGAGAPDNAYATGVSKTVIFSDGNPAVSSSASATSEQTFFQFRWEHICICGSNGTVASIQHWAEATASTRQDGLWLGRNHNYIETITGGETANEGGAGGFTLRNICIQDMSGNGIYGYKLWGKFLANDIFIRRCAGEGAYAEGDDERYAAINLASSTVDCRWFHVHAYGGGYDAATGTYRGGIGISAMSQRGTGMKVGGRKADADAEDQLWDVGSYQILNACHFEGFKLPLNVQSTLFFYADACNFKGPAAGDGACYLGAGPNGVYDVRVLLGTNKFFDVADLYISHGVVHLGNVYNQETGTEMNVHYWSGCTFNGIGGDSAYNGVPLHKLNFVPHGLLDMDGGAGSRPSYQLLPFMSTDYEPTTDTANIITAYAATDGGALVGWVATSGTIAATKRWSLRVKSADGITPGVATYPMTGLTVGQVYTVEFWVDMTGTSHFQDAVSFALVDADTEDVIRRNLGPTATPGDGLIFYRIFNFVATTTAMDFQFRNTDQNNLQLNAFGVYPGMKRAGYAKRWPRVWCSASSGWITCV